jgi:hypothetical protein
MINVMRLARELLLYTLLPKMKKRLLKRLTEKINCVLNVPIMRLEASLTADPHKSSLGPMPSINVCSAHSFSPLYYLIAFIWINSHFSK